MTKKTKKKNKSKSKILNKDSPSAEIVTISGLDIETSAWLIHIIAGLIGIFVFYYVPLLANNLGRPFTAVLLNVIPNSLILGFFVVEGEFKEYLGGISWSPFLNVIANIASYIAMVYFGWSAFYALWLNVFLWIACIFLSLLYNGQDTKKNKEKKKRTRKIFLF